MNKKLMAVAVAGALAAPGIAMAQSSVTISGYFKVGLDNIRVTGATAGAVTTVPTRARSSETRVTDHSSRILFNVTEDLGGGLQTIAQLDVRFSPPDIATPVGLAGLTSGVGSGNTWVGLRSKSWGTLTMGRHDLHYGKAGDDTAAKAGSLIMIASGIFDVVGGPNASSATAPRGTTGRGMANQTRTNNVVRYDTPQWGIFSGTVAYSTNPLQASGGQNMDGDLHLTNGTAVVGATNTGLTGTGPNAGTVIRRKGNGWNINPKLTGSNWFAEWSHWRAKEDTNKQSTVAQSAATLALANQATQHDQKSDTVAGFYRWGGFKLGLAWNRSKTTDPASGYVSGNRRAWSIPMSYTWGSHSVAGHYTRVGDSSNVIVAGATTATDTAVSGSDTGARLWAVAYDYSLSKRTSVGLSYAQLRNRSAATYSMFYNGSTAFGSYNSASLAGEDSRLFAASLRHNF